MTPADRAALEIGRLFMRAHTAEQQVEALAARVAELESQVRELTKDQRA
jgi:hypothetical protein